VEFLPPLMKKHNLIIQLSLTCFLRKKATKDLSISFLDRRESTLKTIRSEHPLTLNDVVFPGLILNFSILVSFTQEGISL